MPEIKSNQLLTEIKELVNRAENLELERVNEMDPGGQAAFCCGCVCVSYCAANSSASMRDLRILVEKGELKLPETLNQILAAEIAKKK